jgi:uncharacterized protein YgiB involved in biofilm formation
LAKELTEQRMKRSRTATLLLMGSAPLLLSACGSNEPDHTRSGLYTSVEACTAATHDVNTCSDAYLKAHQQAEAEAPAYASATACEADYGRDQCVQNNVNGHSFFGPLMAGFMLSQAMRGATPVGAFQSAPAFRNRWDVWRHPAYDNPLNNPPNGGGYASGGYVGGGYEGGSYSSGYYRGGTRGAGGRPMEAVSAAPNRTVTVSRVSTLSRGGFGRLGGSRSSFHGFGS